MSDLYHEPSAPPTPEQADALAKVARILSSFPDTKRAELIPMLQAVQEEEGYLSREAIVAIAARLALPVSKVYGVATFYNQFRFQPKGHFHVQVCRGTACHVKGSASVLSAIKRNVRIEAGQTSRDGLFSLEVVACIGACGLAPVLVVDGDFHANVAPDKVGNLLNSYRKKVVS